MATKLIKDLPLVETLTDTDAVLIQTDNGTQRASLAQIKEVSKGDKGEKGEQGEKGDSGIMPTDMVDYMGNQHESLKDKADSDVEYILGEVNTVHYEGQHITATDTIERQVRSAILKGQTLVNLFNTENIEQRMVTNSSSIAGFDKDTNTAHFLTNLNHLTSYNYSYISLYNCDKYGITKYLKNDTDYTIMWYSEKIRDDDDNKTMIKIGASANVYGTPTLFSKQVNINDGMMLYRTQSSYDDTVLRLLCVQLYNPNNDIEYKLRFVILEGDYTNTDIPYFEGMQSVKMPVLTTRQSANLFNKNNVSSISELDYLGDDFIDCNYGEKYSISLPQDGVYWSSLWFYDENKELIYINIGDSTSSSKTIYVPSVDCKFLKLKTMKSCVDTIMLTRGEPLPYEHYSDKTNILMVNEDVTLRGIGEVKDGFNLLTGELTQRIKELVLNGSESGWFKSSSVTGDGGYRYALRLNDGIVKDHAKIMCDKFVQSENAKIGYVNYSVIDNGLKSALYFNSTAETVDEWKAWLAENNVKVQYQLATESVKAVDLNNQKVYSYDGTTHYTCSSEDGSLIPTLSIDVPTNLPALVSRQRQTIAEQSQTLAEQEEAQNILIDSQLSWYEATAPMTLNLTDEVQIPEYIQKLYKLAYERGIRDSSNAIIEQDLRID